jgi:hypothetical protein
MALSFSKYADTIGVINAMMEIAALNSGREKKPW